MNKLQRAVLNNVVRPVTPGSQIGASAGSTGQVALNSRFAVQIFNPRQRCSVKVTNLSDVDIFLGYDPNVTVNSGDLLLGIRGTFVTIDTQSQLYAIAAGNGASISFLEFLR